MHVFLKHAHLSLKDGGQISLLLTGDVSQVQSFGKMVGLASITLEGQTLKAVKPQLNDAPPKIIRKKKPEQESNPWAALENKPEGGDSNLINEDDLMKESDKNLEVKKFTGEKDVMQRAKACANCSCGLKE